MPDERYQQVDEGLRTYPVKAAPATLAPRVSARLRALTPAPKFRLLWSDYALSLFAAGMLGLGLLGRQLLAPQLLLRLQFYALVVVEQVGIVGGVALAGGLLLAGAACVLAALILAQPFSRSLYRLR